MLYSKIKKSRPKLFYTKVYNASNTAYSQFLPWAPIENLPEGQASFLPCPASPTGTHTSLATAGCYGWFVVNTKTNDTRKTCNDDLAILTACSCTTTSGVTSLRMRTVTSWSNRPHICCTAIELAWHAAPARVASVRCLISSLISSINIDILLVGRPYSHTLRIAGQLSLSNDVEPANKTCTV